MSRVIVRFDLDVDSVGLWFSNSEEENVGLCDSEIRGLGDYVMVRFAASNSPRALGRRGELETLRHGDCETVIRHCEFGTRGSGEWK